MIQYTTKASLHLTPIADLLETTVPRDFLDAVKRLADKAHEKHGGFLTIRLELPRRPRTTGKHSQNNFAHGASADIALQLSTPEREYGTTDVYEAMKRLAVKEGYPTVYEELDDSVQPKHLADATMEEAAIVCRVMTKFADEHGFWLTRYDKQGIAYRSLGGRSRKEMEALG